MPELEGFPQFPRLKDVPVAAAPTGRKRARFDHQAPVLPPMLESAAGGAAA
jgi:hypothetical protein